MAILKKSCYKSSNDKVHHELMDDGRNEELTTNSGNPVKRRRQRQPLEENSNENAVKSGTFRVIGNFNRRQRTRQQEKQLMRATLQTEVLRLKKNGGKKCSALKVPRNRLKLLPRNLKDPRFLRLSNWQYQLTSERF